MQSSKQADSSDQRESPGRLDVPAGAPPSGLRQIVLSFWRWERRRRKLYGRAQQIAYTKLNSLGSPPVFRRNRAQPREARRNFSHQYAGCLGDLYHGRENLSLEGPETPGSSGSAPRPGRAPGRGKTQTSAGGGRRERSRSMARLRAMVISQETRSPRAGSKAPAQETRPPDGW